MGDWIWALAALAVGLPLLLGATLLDLRRRRRAQGPPPGREDRPGSPGYLTQEQVDALPSPARSGAQWPRHGRAFGFGYAHPDFRTHGPSAQWTEATVLVVDGDISAMRQLTPVLGRATEASPLVVVATGLAPEVATTLAANRRALHLPALACLASPDELRAVAAWCGAQPLAPSDLSAGYIPAEALGKARRWVSEARRSWVETGFAHHPEGVRQP